MARSAARQRGEKEGRGGGAWGRGCHAVRGWSWGVAPTVSRTRRARAARSDSGALALAWVGLGGSESGEGAERREWRAGQPEKKTGWPSPDKQ
jgi:hypothetical protein